MIEDNWTEGWSRYLRILKLIRASIFVALIPWRSEYTDQSEQVSERGVRGWME